MDKFGLGELDRVHREDFFADLAVLSTADFTEVFAQTGEALTREEERTIALDLMTSGCLRVFDFGGQADYLPWNRGFLTPHALYEVVVDLSATRPGTALEPDLEAMAESMVEQLEDMVARVPDAVFLVVGTKAELLGPTALETALDQLTCRLQAWEADRAAFAERHFRAMQAQLEREERDADGTGPDATAAGGGLPRQRGLSPDTRRPSMYANGAPVPRRHERIIAVSAKTGFGLQEYCRAK
ncbi:MAG: hypothetical protein AAFS07_19240, partial [Pseudomonadota bacterium]